MENPFKKLSQKKASSGKLITPLLRVNLLIHKGEQPKLYTKLLRWLLSSGRYIVILVELVTISAFVLRYKLDGDLEQLHTEIEKTKPLIQSLKNDEIEIRETQFQLKTIKQSRLDSPDFTAVFVKIAELTPKQIKLTNISLDRTNSYPKTSIVISGQSPASKELSAFIKALQKDAAFSDITLTNISFDELTSFTITGTLSEKGGSST